MEDEPQNVTGLQVEDRLSSLPESLLVEILSLLPIRSAVVTSALSRRWRRRWTQIHRLVFDKDYRFSLTDEDQYVSVDHILQQITAPKVRSFRILLPFPDTHEEPLFKSWIEQMCARNVEEIEVQFMSFQHLILLPACVFECQYLVSLCLRAEFDFELPGDGICLPKLKKLGISLRNSHRELLPTLLKSCPLLEHLRLLTDFNEDDYYVDISCQNLRSLNLGVYNSSKWTRFVIDAPNLECTEIVISPNSFYRFVSNPIGLLKTTIWFGWEKADIHYSEKAMVELVQGISSTKSLSVYGPLYSFLQCLRNGNMPVFRSLTNFSTALDYFSGWNDLLRFLHFAPNLEVLHLVAREIFMGEAINWDWPDSVTSVPVCLIKKLRSIEIDRLQGSYTDTCFLHYILAWEEALEQLHVKVHNSNADLQEEYDLCRALFSYCSESSACEIQFSGRRLSASNKGYDRGHLDCRIHSDYHLERI